MSDKSLKIEAALYAKLNVATVVGSGLATKVYNERVAPNDAVYPFLIFFRIPLTVDHAFGTEAGERDRWQITCFSDKAAANPKSPKHKNHELLAAAWTAIGGSLTISGGRVTGLRRVLDVPEFKETVNNAEVVSNGFQMETYAS